MITDLVKVTFDSEAVAFDLHLHALAAMILLIVGGVGLIIAWPVCPTCNCEDEEEDDA